MKPAQYFLDRRTVDPITSCWNWTGAKLPNGYGYMKHNYRNCGAHRGAYETFKGGIPDGQIVRHSCDNPGCINPAHLILGTNLDNTVDMLDRGRNHSKLSRADIELIKSMYPQESMNRLADKFGVTNHTISNIVNGVAWSTV